MDPDLYLLVPYQTKTFESAPFAGQGSFPVIAQIGDCVERDKDIHTLQNHAVIMGGGGKILRLTHVLRTRILRVAMKVLKG